MPGWRVVFADDFTRNRLSPRKWGAYSGQPGGDPGGWWDPSHVVVHNGILDLRTYRDARFGGQWVSGGVSSAPGLLRQFGKYLVRFRMDPGQGISGVLLLWPAANHWPPEIDFAENGGETNDRSRMTATLHYGKDGTIIQHAVSADFTKWHTMGVLWSRGRLVYTLDGRPWATVVSPHVPAEKMEMDIQSQAGTCGDQSAPCPDLSTRRLVDLQVDWVVVYKRTSGRR